MVRETETERPIKREVRREMKKTGHIYVERQERIEEGIDNGSKEGCSREKCNRKVVQIHEETESGMKLNWWQGTK